MSKRAFVWCFAASMWLQSCQSVSRTTNISASATTGEPWQGFATNIIGADCYAPPGDPAVTEITIHRDGGCIGYYLPANSHSRGPVFLTGACAGYTLILRRDGSAEYWDEDNVPIIGHRIGSIDRTRFQDLARLMSEVGFETWPDIIAPRSGSEEWICVSFDGAPPLTISIIIRGQRKTIRHEQPDQPGSGPEWLRLIEQKLELIGESTAWR